MHYTLIWNCTWKNNRCALYLKLLNVICFFLFIQNFIVGAKFFYAVARIVYLWWIILFHLIILYYNFSHIKPIILILIFEYVIPIWNLRVGDFCITLKIDAIFMHNIHTSGIHNTYFLIFKSIIYFCSCIPLSLYKCTWQYLFFSKP